jgi:hypothetical protein
MRRARRSSSSGEMRATSPPRSAATTFSVLLMKNVTLFFEHAELRADGGIIGLVGELFEDLADGGSFELVENVHNLAFAAGEGFCFGFSCHMLFF